MRVRLLIGLILFIGVVTGLIVRHGCESRSKAQTLHLPPTAAAAISSRQEKRQVLPFSIVPGGIRSTDELRSAMRTDPLVHVHYAGVKVDQLRMFTLPRPSMAYVSFRMSGKAYWTSRKVRLAKGERVFQGSTPEDIGVRERCGNQISRQPRLPILPNPKLEPTSLTLSTPIPQIAIPAPVPRISALPTPALSTSEQPSLTSNELPEVPLAGGGSIHGISGGGGGGIPGGAGGGTALIGNTTSEASPGQSSGIILAPTLFVNTAELVAVSPPVSSLAPTSPALPIGANPGPYTLSPPAFGPGISIFPTGTLASPPAVPTCCQSTLAPSFEVEPTTQHGPPPSASPVVPPGTTWVLQQTPETAPSPIPTVPEPSTWAMLCIGTVLMLIGSKFRRPGQGEETAKVVP